VNTEYRYDAEALSAETQAKRDALRENRGLSDLLGFGLSVVAGRLKANPQRYLDYGPYWWALKDALNRNGYGFGSETDLGIAAEYRGGDDTETLVAADIFREEYLASSIVGTRRFVLDPDAGEWWTLFDEEMEERASR